MNRSITQKGFTLIELIVVIVILGILAATALPKFVNLGGDSRLAVMKGLEGSMRGANALIYARSSLAVPSPVGTCTGTVVVVSGQNVATCFGYAQTLAAVQLVMDISPITDFTIAGNVIQSPGAGTPANCQITYAPPAAVNTPPTYTENPNPLTAVGCL